MTQSEKELQRLSISLAVTSEQILSLRVGIEELKEESNNQKLVAERLREGLISVQTQVAVLQASFEDFKKRWDDSDRRRWTVYGVMIAAGLTFVANLILLFFKR